MPHPGFDTSSYPGDAAMATWREASPYEWAGYYLGGPCHSDQSWRGKRAHLEASGWGVVPAYVGRQVAGASECSKNVLTAELGTADAADAVAKMHNDGFPRLRYVYLDIEPIDSFPAEMGEYAKAWFDGVLKEGSFLPGAYCHKKNVGSVRPLLFGSLVARGHEDPPRLWICGGNLGYTIHSSPADSGEADVFIWQGDLGPGPNYEGRSLTFGGVSLVVDQNVALTSTPGE